MKLAYQAIDSQGNRVSATIEAGDQHQAMESLHRDGLYVTDIGQEQQQDKTRQRLLLPLSKGRRMKYLTEFTRHLYVLLCSGTTLVQALTSLERQARDPRWREVVKSIRVKIEEGGTLASALQDMPEYFDPITCGLISAGESSGNLEEMLDHVSRLKQKQLRIRRQIIGALTYPALVVLVSMNVVFALMSVVLPRFSDLFATLNVPLPPSTKVLMTVSTTLQSYWWLAGGAVVCAAVVMWRYLISAHGRRLIDTALVRLPVVSTVVCSLITARVVRLLGVLLGSHLGMLEALRLTQGAAGNYHYAELLGKAEEAATMGNSLSSAFSDSGLIAPSVYEALHSGEQSGSIDSLLITVADFMDEDNEVVLSSVMSIVGPAILACLGVFIGFVAVSLFLPLFDLTAASSSGGGS